MSETRKTTEGGLYFVTFATVGWIDVFTRSDYVIEIMDNIKYCQQNKGLNLYAWCIMSNHIHMVASAENGTLSELLRDFKSYTAKRIIGLIKDNAQESRKDWMLDLFERYGRENSQNKKYQFWQHSNHPVELYSGKVIDQKVDYIHNNPVKAGIVNNPEDYKYSSANEFSEIKVLEL